MSKSADDKKQEPDFGDDYFWWIETYGDNPPDEYQGKFVLVHNKEILGSSENEDDMVRLVEEMGLENKYYVIMPVSVEPIRPDLEISLL